jgi:hypothetical protein
LADHKHDQKAEPKAAPKAEPKAALEAEPRVDPTPEEQMQMPHSINEPPGSEVIVPDGDGENTLAAQKAGVQPLTPPPRKKHDEDENDHRKRR